MGDKIKKVKIYRVVDSPLEQKVQMDDSDMDILNNLISLSKRKKNKEEKVEKKKKKKDKKKKKKKEKDKIKAPKMDLSALKIYDDDEVERDNTDFYEQRFSSSLILLKDILKEINVNIVDNKKFLEELKSGYIGNNRVKMSPMTMTSLMGNIASLVNTKLSAVKQITDVNKSISDLELKKLTADQKVGSSKEDEKTNSKMFMNKMFDQIMNFEMPDDPTIDVKTEKKKKNKEKKYKSIDERIDALAQNGDIEFTDNELAFKYEKNGVEIAIEKDLKTGKWDFVAYNSNGEELGDYPLPSKDNVGKMKFDDKSDTAKDALGQRYNVYYV